MGTKDRGNAGGYAKDLFQGKKRKGGGRETVTGALRYVSARRVPKINTKTKSPSVGFKKRIK